MPTAWRTRQIDFGSGPVPTVTIPWGDVVTAWHTTGIPDIEVYMALPERAIRRLRRTRWLAPLLGLGPVRRTLQRRVQGGPAGPSAQRLASGVTRQWGEVVGADGRRAVTLQQGPQAYRWTAWTAVAAVERVLGGVEARGFQTPAAVFGADFVLGMPGVERRDLPITGPSRG